MSESIQKPKLGLVQKATTQVAIDHSWTSEDGVQRSFFPMNSPNLLIFVEMSHITEKDFCNLILEIKPRVVIDVRAVSRFDIGQLNRKKALHLFKESNSHYLEAPKLFRTDDIEMSNSSYKAFHVHMSKLLNKGKLVGPVVVLVNQFRREADYLRFIPKMLPSQAKTGWEIFSVS